MFARKSELQIHKNLEKQIYRTVLHGTQTAKWLSVFWKAESHKRRKIKEFLQICVDEEVMIADLQILQLMVHPNSQQKFQPWSVNNIPWPTFSSTCVTF